MCQHLKIPREEFKLQSLIYFTVNKFKSLPNVKCLVSFKECLSSNLTKLKWFNYDVRSFHKAELFTASELKITQPNVVNSGIFRMQLLWSTPNTEFVKFRHSCKMCTVKNIYIQCTHSTFVETSSPIWSLNVRQFLHFLF